MDLTIADEDVSKQFWFIDFRFACTPAATNLPDSLRSYLESCVNEALREEGLLGCYQFLHEFVLTYKINEFKRQALLLNKTFWTGNLKVEPLHRALAIQYWINQGPNGSPKSWVLIAVESSKGKGTHAKHTSSLVAKWYRDNKEVPDAALVLDEENISAETLLRDVVSLHIEHLLRSIHDKLTSVPRFQNEEAGISLRTSRINPSASTLAMQVGNSNEVALLIEPATGSFAVKPHSKLALQQEHQLNNSARQAQDGANCLEAVRCALIEDDISRKANQMGWVIKKAPIAAEKLRAATGLRDWTRAIYLQREGWEPHWCIVVFLGMSGDVWWLIEGYDLPPSVLFQLYMLTSPCRDRSDANRAPKFNASLPLKQGLQKMADAFWDDLTLYATGMIAQAIDLADLHRAGIKSRTNEEASWSLSQNITLPAVEIALSAIFPAMFVNGSRKLSATYEHPSAEALRTFLQPNASLFSQANQPWASDLVTVRFKGLESGKTLDASGGDSATDQLMRVSDAIIHVENPARFAALDQTPDRHVSFRPKTGEFRLELRHPVGQPILPALRSRIKTVDRFVNFLEAVENSKGGISRGEVSLKAVSCTYPDSTLPDAGDVDVKPRLWEMGLQLATDEIQITLQKDNPHLRVIDLLQKLTNTDGGITSLMTWLPVSIAAMRAIRDIETRWSELESASKGHVRVFPKTLDWLGMTYTITPTGRPAISANFDLRLKLRRGSAVWHLERLDTNLGKDDLFGPALQNVWAGRGNGWFGLRSSAAGEPEGGVSLMLASVDEAVRGLLTTAAALAPAPAPKTKPRKASDVVVLD